MRMADLKKGTVYAWKFGYESDIRILHNFIKVEYLGPVKAVYDRYRPTKRLNSGKIIVKLLQEYKGSDRWSSTPPVVHPIGHEMEIVGKELLLSWDDLVERAGETHAASLAAEAYLQSMKDLIKEFDPKLSVDHESWRRRGDVDIEINLRHSDHDIEFDPEDVQVQMKAETLRKLISGVRG